MSGSETCPKCKGRKVIDIGNYSSDYIDCMRCRGTGTVDIPAPFAYDTEQIDDRVQDLYMTGVADGVVDWYGGISPDADVFERMYQRFRKDLASLGIRLTYDTTIGGE